MSAEMDSRRREAVRSYGLLDTAPEVAYDEICRLAAHVCGTPIAALSLTDVDRVWIKAGVGVGTGAIDRDTSLCGKVAEAGESIVVSDATLDERFRRSPLVTGDPGIRFYAGAPLLTPAGVAVGALCVADRAPGVLTPAQADALAILARQAVVQMELRREAGECGVAVRRLAEQGEMLRTIFELEPECVKVVDLDGTIRRMNPAGLAFLEAEEPGEVLGKALIGFVVPEDRDRVLAFLERIRAGGTAMIEFEVVGLRGGRRTVESHAVPMRGPDGSVQGGLAVTRDVTARRKAEAALRQKEHELSQSQKMEAVGRMAGGVAHDFNNILTALVGYGEMLLEELPRGAPAHAHALEVMRAAERATRLCRRLLAFSRKQPFRPEVLDLGSVVAEIVGMLRPLLGEGVDLATSVPEGLWSVQADRSQMEQVVVNLAVNARDAMPRGGRLTVEARNVVLGSGSGPSGVALPPGRYAALSVRDTGCGMGPEVLAHLFEPFFTTKEKGKGTGLGLSTVYGIVRQSGGHIEVASRPGEGTAFTIYLPTVEAAPASPPPAPAPRPSRVQGKGILVVEDAVDIRFLVRKILEARGYRVLEASTGLDALLELSARREEVQLLLTDVTLPGITGLELATRARISRPDVRILVMSGRPEDPKGVDGFLSKPFTPDELVRAVQAALGE